MSKRNTHQSKIRKEYNKRYYQKHKHLRDEYTKKYQLTVRGKYITYKASAKQRGLPFTLTLMDFEKRWKKPCYYCGTKIKNTRLNRIDTTKGYIKNNIISCCASCNKLKKSLTKKEFLKYIIKIYKYQRKRGRI